MKKSSKILFLVVMIMVFTITILSTRTYGSVETIHDDNQDYRLSLMPETKFYDDYEKIVAPENTVVVYPILTQTAYSWKGIHDYYSGYCDDCTTVKIEDHYEPIYSIGGNSFRVLEFLGYDVIDDMDIDKNPSVLDKYDSVVLLHNEFVTQKEFDAIQNHKNIIYLYPGALKNQVSIDYPSHSMSLIRGPNYPEKTITNGFDWALDNSINETNTSCEAWSFEKIDNGYMLNCYPEYKILEGGTLLLEKIKELSSTHL